MVILALVTAKVRIVFEGEVSLRTNVLTLSSTCAGNSPPSTINLPYTLAVWPLAYFISTNRLIFKMKVQKSQGTISPSSEEICSRACKLDQWTPLKSSNLVWSIIFPAKAEYDTYLPARVGNRLNKTFSTPHVEKPRFWKRESPAIKWSGVFESAGSGSGPHAIGTHVCAILRKLRLKAHVGSNNRLLLLSFALFLLQYDNTNNAISYNTVRQRTLLLCMWTGAKSLVVGKFRP